MWYDSIIVISQYVVSLLNQKLSSLLNQHFFSCFFTAKHDMIFMEASAQDKVNVEEAFSTLVEGKYPRDNISTGSRP